MVGAYTFDKIGPLTRSAADCRLVLQAIAGPDPDDASACDEPVRLEGGGISVSRLRGALVEPLDFAKTKGAEPEVKSAFDAAVAELESAGLKLERASLPEFPASEVAGLLITAEALSTFENFYKNGGVWQLKDPYAPYQPEISSALTGADVVKAWRMRAVLQEKTAEFFSRYDVVVTPNFMSVAPSIHGDLNQALPYTDPAGAIGNACGLPSIALPAGFGKGHMPVSFQIMGAPFEEATLIRLGELYQGRTGFHKQRPPLQA
jgi:aspartyl-tRNA(Asn)/glutamyl-tRNA(Gln) amidotransferase subunit A